MFDGKKLKLIRINAGLHQVDVAKKLGCDGNEIWRYEDGRVKPRPERIPQLAKILNCRPEDFDDSSSLPQTAGGFSQDDMALIEALLALDPIRRAKIIGYIDGYMASSAPVAAASASGAADAVNPASNIAQKRRGRPPKT